MSLINLTGSSEKDRKREYENTQETTSTNQTEKQVGYNTTNQQKNSTENQVAQSVSESQQQGIQSSQQNTQSSQTSTSAQQSAGQAQQSENQTQQLFSSEILSTVENLVQSLAGEDRVSSQAILDLLTNRATDAESAINTNIDAIINSARSTGERELKSLQNILAQQAGGSIGNTNVLAGTADATADLETQLAALSANLGIEARQIGTQELQAAATLQGNQNASNQAQLSELLNVLKGGQAVSSGQTNTQTAQQTEAQQQTDLVSSISSLVDTLTSSSEQTTAETVSSLYENLSAVERTNLTNILDSLVDFDSKRRKWNERIKHDIEAGFTI